MSSEHIISKTNLNTILMFLSQSLLHAFVAWILYSALAMEGSCIYIE
jgi:hypothetical protein